MPPTAQDFQNELNNILMSTQKRGKSYVDVLSGDLHTHVGDYPAHYHRMPLFCSVMKRNMKAEDRILQEPDSGQGATLIIRYKLPKL